MEKYVLEALFQMGEPTFALERMKQRYTRMLDYAEYTTLFEDGASEPRASVAARSITLGAVARLPY